MNKNIYIVGPSSTGKTTLVNALAQKLNLHKPAVVTEVARDIMATRGFSRKDVGSLEMQEAILSAHLAGENEARGCAMKLCDRSAIDPIVYAVMTSETAEEANRRRDVLVSSPEFSLAHETYKQSTFILLAPVPDWLTDDGVRLVEQQARCFEVFQAELTGLEIDFHVMGPETRFMEERIVRVLGWLKL